VRSSPELEDKAARSLGATHDVHVIV